MPGQGGGMHKDFAAMSAFFRHPFMHLFHMPIQFSLSFEHLTTVTKELFGGLDGPVFIMNSFVFTEI